MAKMQHIRGVLVAVSSQRTQYKPYHYELNFDGIGDAAPMILVEFDIPYEDVVEEGMGYVVVDLDGLNAILEVTADSLDKLNAKYLDKIQKGGK